MADAPDSPEAVEHTLPSGVPSDATLVGMAVGGAGAVGLAVLADATGGAVGVPCLLRATTGLACPFCGATRMGAALLRGDLGEALRLNAPVLVAGLMVGYLWVSWVLERLGVARAPRPRLTPRTRRLLVPILVTLALTFTVVRNLPWEPFAALRP
ncbi:DUF2752 domain-containing protein [Thermasporomyces composti]|jgi:hypothetical protein|uniref:Uncharacterized protein DUF2752 n=1 Tax=Thermasporomyces composti TaxID=696763 RepID=A0A3D9UZ29_THECX|nr:DUF2752 domain-containing protein [Thermasporomyces composti]REF34748.1 uncharacterized protein DUF2752 [Thermasporomyces composti]